MKSKRFLIGVVAISMIALAAFFWVKYPFLNGSVSGDQKVVLSGNTPPAVHEARQLGHGNPTQAVRVVVGLKLRNGAALEQLLAEQADPASPNYRKYLTPDEFTRRFAPTQADYDKVVRFLQSQGLTVTVIAPNRLIVGAEGTVQQVEHAFGVTIYEYRYQGRVVYSNAADPQIPAALQGIVESVMGLNSFAQFHSRSIPSPRPHQQQGSGPVGLTPQQVATAYDYPNVNNAAKGNKYGGKGRTIAIATAYGYSQSDVDAYWKQFGIKRSGSVTNVAVGGTTTQLDGETTLDLEQIGAQAPDADIIMYEGVDPEFSTFTLIFNQIVTDDKADIVSVSWGACERETGVAQMKTEDAIYRQAAAQGIPVFSASGDDGAYDCQEPAANGKHIFLHPTAPGKKPAPKVSTVDFPASDPYVVAVGGTSLYLNPDNSRASERAWSGAGGGVSIYWARPAWQKGPGVPAGKKRVSSDISLVADPWTGYAIYFQGAWDEAGGTSFAAPNSAALWALVEEAAGGRVGSVNAELYELGRSADYGKVFHDITQGDNGNGQGPGFKAGPGWDHPTGWGTPDGDALASWIKARGQSPAAAGSGK